MMKVCAKARIVVCGIGVILLSACMAKDVELTEQQRRMQRCDQYIGDQREDCLRGMPVTIDDYKDDYRDYLKSRKKEAKDDEKPIDLKPVKAEEKEEDKPT